MSFEESPLFLEGINCRYSTNGNSIIVYNLENETLFSFERDPEEREIVFLSFSDKKTLVLVESENPIGIFVYLVTINSGQVEMIFRVHFSSCESIHKTNDGFILIFNRRIVIMDSNFNRVRSVNYKDSIHAENDHSENPVEWGVDHIEYDSDNDEYYVFYGDNVAYETYSCSNGDMTRRVVGS